MIHVVVGQDQGMEISAGAHFQEACDLLGFIGESPSMTMMPRSVTTATELTKA